MNRKLSDHLARVVMLALLLATTATIYGQDWPQWRGEDRNSRVSGFKAPARWPSGLKKEWSVEVGFGDATPALSNGRLYVFTRVGGDELLQCLDAKSGKQLWKQSYPANEVTGPAVRHPGPRSTPTVTGGKVITIGATGILSCWQESSGKLLWRNSEYADLVPVYFTGLSPLVLDNRVYAHLGGAERSAIMAFDLETGKVEWKYEGEGPAYASPDVMLTGNTKCIVLQTDRTLISLKASDGKVLWSLPTPVERRYYNSASPVVDGNRIYHTGQGRGTAGLNIGSKGNEYTVEEVWRNTAIGTTYNTPVLKDGFLYGYSDRGYLFCLDASTGSTAWADTTRHRDFGSVIDAGKLMIALSSSSNLVVFNPGTKSYDEVAVIKVSDTPTYAQPIVSGKQIYIKDERFLVMYSVE